MSNYKAIIHSKKTVYFQANCDESAKVIAVLIGATKLTKRVKHATV